MIELLITMMIIAILASIILFALFRAQETAKEQKTRALITKLDAIIKSKWENYKTRRVPVTILPTDGPAIAAQKRLNGLRELMRMEMPDRYTDLVTVNAGPPDTVVPTSPVLPSFVTSRPTVTNAYLRRIQATATAPSTDNQGAEMLYMIVTATLAEEGDAPDVFKADNVGDTDQDGMPEFIDGWGKPIKFLRWAPGFQSDLQILGTGKVSNVDTGPPVVVTVQGAGLSTASGAYVGGTIGVIDGTSTLTIKPLDGKRTARITGYHSTGASTADFTCAGSSTFNGTPPMSGDNVVIFAPDPFDPLGVYAVSNATSASDFVLYPFIYSPGPDGYYGTVAEAEETSGGPPFAYSNHQSNPFYVHSTTAPAGLMFGAAADTKSEPPGINAAADNIHNHLIGRR